MVPAIISGRVSYCLGNHAKHNTDVIFKTSSQENQYLELEIVFFFFFNLMEARNWEVKIVSDTVSSKFLSHFMGYLTNSHM